MALQILDERFSPSLAGRLGQGLGESVNTGLSYALQNLASQKMQDIAIRKAQARVAPGLQSLGFSQEDASALAGLPENVQREIVKQKLLQPQMQAEQQLAAKLLGLGGQEQQQQIPELGQFLNPQQMGQRGIQSNQQPQSPQLGAGLKASDLAGIRPGKALEFAKYAQTERLAEKRIAADEKKEAIKAAAKEKLETQKQKERAFKETKDIRKAAVAASKSSKEQLHNLNRFEELEKEGKLDTPGYVNFLKESGLDIPALMNPGSEEFNKIAASFQRGAREIYGARISNYELEQFLQTLPNLSQSPQGRKRVISNMKRLNRANLEYFNTMQDIIKENKGTPPLDLDEQIEQRIDPKLNKLAEQFKKDLERTVPSGQNKLVTALQTVTGKAAGNVGKLAKAAAGAYTGARLGRLLGPYGAAAGGILGGLGGLSGLV